MREEVGFRLRIVREKLGETQKTMSTRLALGASTWQTIELGKNLPSGETLSKIADLGFNPGWLLTGRGPMLLMDIVEAKAISGSNVSDPELLARVNDAIANIYKEEGYEISPADMGRIAADRYAAILNASSNPAERVTMVKLIETQLRQEITRSSVPRTKHKTRLKRAKIPKPS